MPLCTNSSLPAFCGYDSHKMQGAFFTMKITSASNPPYH